jgi:hypothetical protein
MSIILDLSLIRTIPTYIHIESGALAVAMPAAVWLLPEIPQQLGGYLPF